MTRFRLNALSAPALAAPAEAVSRAEADIEKVERDATVEVIGAKGMVLRIRTIRDANEPLTPSKSV